MNDHTQNTQRKLVDVHVWWGDPALPQSGRVVALSRDQAIAFVRLAPKQDMVQVPVHWLHIVTDAERERLNPPAGLEGILTPNS
jgi:hypothetical protein